MNAFGHVNAFNQDLEQVVASEALNLESAMGFARGAGAADAYGLVRGAAADRSALLDLSRQPVALDGGSVGGSAARTRPARPSRHLPVPAASDLVADALAPSPVIADPLINPGALPVPDALPFNAPAAPSAPGPGLLVGVLSERVLDSRSLDELAAGNLTLEQFGVASSSVDLRGMPREDIEIRSQRKLTASVMSVVDAAELNLAGHHTGVRDSLLVSGDQASQISVVVNDQVALQLVGGPGSSANLTAALPLVAMDGSTLVDSSGNDQLSIQALQQVAMEAGRFADLEAPAVVQVNLEWRSQAVRDSLIALEGGDNQVSIGAEVLATGLEPDRLWPEVPQRSINLAVHAIGMEGSALLLGDGNDQVEVAARLDPGLEAAWSGSLEPVTLERVALLDSLVDLGGGSNSLRVDGPAIHSTVIGGDSSDWLQLESGGTTAAAPHSVGNRFQAGGGNDGLTLTASASRFVVEDASDEQTSQTFLIRHAETGQAVVALHDVEQLQFTDSSVDLLAYASPSWIVDNGTIPGLMVDASVEAIAFRGSNASDMYSVTFDAEKGSPRYLNISGNGGDDTFAILGQFAGLDPQRSGPISTISRFDGGSGSDTLILPGRATDYRFTYTEDITFQPGTLISLVANPQARLAVFNVETISYNNPPAAIGISTTTIAEGTRRGSVVASFSTSDPNSGDSFTYSLAGGADSSDNAAFSIKNNQLILNTTAKQSLKPTYEVLVQSTDSKGLSIVRPFTLTVSSSATSPVPIRQLIQQQVEQQPAWRWHQRLQGQPS